MAGLGRKVWGAGDVLAAADVNGYLMDQSVMAFADATARTAAVGTPTQGMVSYLQDTSTLQVYGTAWADVSNPGDITAVTAGTALTGGGSTGDVTLNVDLAAITIPASQISDLTATAAELNILDGVTATATELNYVDGVTSAIQTQLDGLVSETNGAVTTAATGSTVVRNITLSTSTPTGGSDGDVWLVYTA